LIENLMSARVKQFRQAFYQYHRLGLDVMHQDTEEGQKIMSKCIDQFSQVQKNYPNNSIIPAMLSTKSAEIIEVFKMADRNSKTKLFQTLSQMDPANVQKYSVLRF